MAENSGTTVQDQDGGRHVVTTEHAGATIEVVAGYEITCDDWPLHVFVTLSGQRQRLTDVPTRHRESTKQLAVAKGMEMATQWIGNQRSGFQKEIRTEQRPA